MYREENDSTSDTTNKPKNEVNESVSCEIIRIKNEWKNRRKRVEQDAIK